MKKIVVAFAILLLTFLISGCGTPNTEEITFGNVMKSADGALTWAPKVKVGDKKNIASVEVLSMAIHPSNPGIVYIGTRESGIFKTNDGGESWAKIDFPPIKNYGLVIDHFNPEIIYATGVWQERGKIYKSEDGGVNWKEIYTEPADGTVVTALAASPSESGNLYGATSEGAIFHTTDGGKTWQNIFHADGPLTAISFDGTDLKTVYFLVLGRSALMTRDGGMTVSDLSKNVMNGEVVRLSQPQSLAVDAKKSGVIYIGTEEGIVKSDNFGDNWQAVNILDSSRKFPVRAIAVSPADSSEIMYGSAQAVYRSTDGGQHWSITQLETRNVVSVIRYNPANPSEIYLGLKKE